MILTIHQPEHLPWLGFFHKMASADLFVLLDNVQYRHHYFQNRNRLLGNGEVMWLTVPISKRETLYGRISEQRIEEVGPWRRKYWKSIEQNYGRHPHFERYEKPLKAILFSSFERLVDLNGALIDFFRSELGITTPLLRASTLGVEGNKSELLHSICRKVEAETYLSGPSGRDYLDESLFHSSGIGVLYHGFEHPVYPQFRAKSFIPQLSTLDLLFNCGPESRDHFLPS